MGVRQEPHAILALPYLAAAMDPGVRRDDSLFGWFLMADILISAAGILR